MEDGPPIFEQDVTCPALLIAHLVPQLPVPVRGYHPLWPDFPDRSRKLAAIECWALPISLAATFGIDVSFSSSGYLDVSVHRVPGVWLWIHHTSLKVYLSRFPHSEISGSKDICSSPKLIAAYHVFHRLLVPRHPPCALSSLTRCLFTAGTAPKRRCIALHPWLFVYIFRFAYLSICLGCLVS